MTVMYRFKVYMVSQNPLSYGDSYPLRGATE